MSLRNIFSSLAPMAAGALAGPMGFGYALAAGAATGAGIAALRDEDPLMGAVTGGMSGVGGRELGAGLRGMNPVTQGGVNYGTTSAGNATLGGSTFNTAVGTGSTEGLNALKLNPMGTPTGGTTGSLTGGLKAAINDPKAFLSKMGGGDTLKGGLKTAGALAPGVAGAMVPDMTTAEVNNSKYGYDPKRRLNLNRNTGLKLMQEGGYLETGMGDGMSDDIPSSIDNEQPAALSENEFVIPADVVSGLGNGSSDAGAEQLYNMMDRVRKARTGNEKQGREIMPQEYMPA